MAKVYNNVLVLYAKANERVRVDFCNDEGRCWAYPNNHYANKNERRVRFLLKDYFFSGIMFRQLASSVVLEVIDWEGNTLDHTFHENYLYIEPSKEEYYEVIFKLSEGKLKPTFVEQQLEVDECESFVIQRKL